MIIQNVFFTFHYFHSYLEVKPMSNSQNVFDDSSKGKSCKDQCKNNENYDRCFNDCKIEKEQPIIQIISITFIVLGLMFMLFIIWKRKQVLRLFRCVLNRRTIMMESFLNNAILIKNSNVLLNQFRKVAKMLNQSKNELIFTQNGKLHKEEDVQIICKINEKEQYIAISLLGNDKYGTWSGNGVTIIDFNNQLKIWFVKDYEEQQEARQSGLWEHLIYQGEFDEEVRAFSRYGIMMDQKMIQLTVFILLKRSTINYLSQDLDSPARQRIKLLSDKWNHIQNGIDKDKLEKREVLEERIKIIEDVLASEKPKDEQRFKVLKDQVLKLQDQAHNQKSEREAFDDKKEKDFRTLSDNVALSFDQERNARGQAETKLQKQIDERFAQITLTITRNTHQYEDRSQAKIAEIKKEDQAAESLAEQIDSEINKFSDQLLIEKKVREETQGKIFRMIEDVHGKLQQDISFERREREATTEALLKLLEDACIKIDKNFRSF